MLSIYSVPQLHNKLVINIRVLSPSISLERCLSPSRAHAEACLAVYVPFVDIHVGDPLGTPYVTVKRTLERDNDS